MVKKFKKDLFNKELLLILKKYNGELISFEYYKKAFGDIIVKMRVYQKEIVFATDRGEIYCDGKFLCGYEYVRNENKSTSQKLLELIDERLSLLE